MEMHLTVGQEALWFIQSVDPDCSAYNATGALTLHFPADAAMLEAAVRATVYGHELLSSVFGLDAAGEIRRSGGARSADCTPLEVHASDLDGPQLREFVLGLARRPFRLDRELPVRVALVRTGRGPDILLCVAHHIVADNVSQLLICQEILSQYAAIQAGTVRDPPETGAAFDDFARRQRDYLASPRAERARDFWRRELRSVWEFPALPTELPRPAVYRFEGSEIDFELPAELMAALDEAAAAANATVFAYLMSVFEVLLYQYSGLTRSVIGYPVTQRRAESDQDAIGYFVNTLPLCASLDPEDSFDAVLRATSARLWRCLMHRDYPFALMPRLTGSVRDPSRPGLIPIMFAVNEPGGREIAAALEPGRRVEHAGLSVTEYRLPQQQGQFELTLQVSRVGAAALATLKYNTSLFTGPTARRLAGDYRELLRSAVRGTLPTRLRELRDRSANQTLLLEASTQ
jgi:Condensation domain